MNSVGHLSIFLNKLKNNEPFSIIRPADGEYQIMTGQHLTNCDNWTFSGGCLQQDLLNITSYIGTENLYIGIPCKGCNENIYNYYVDTLNLNKYNNYITYANVFCNNNWKDFISNIKNTPFYYIGPGENNKELKIIDNFLIDPYLVNKWDNIKDIFIRALITWVGIINKLENNKDKNLIFMFSAGPISKVVIPLLFKLYPKYTFMDVGSTLDIFTKGSSNRYYIKDNDDCSNIVCDFINGHNILSKSDIPSGEIQEDDVTVILNFYKRPHTILEQLEAIKNQTRKPKEIIIWRNYSEFDLPKEVKEDSSITIIDSNKNFGVWARFGAVLLANTPYVCVFDDDTIPGKKWLENCLNTMKKVNGLLGTIGLIFKKDKGYESEYPRMGWEGMNEEIKQVDIVGHSWFFKREWVHHLWSAIPDYNLFLKSGEDIAFSWALQQIGINTYVPPHPSHDQEMFGSIPSKAWSYGTDSVSISLSGVNFDYALSHFVDRGFKKLRDFSNFCSEYDNFKYYHNDPVFHDSIIKGNSEAYSEYYNVVKKYTELFPHKNRTFVDIGAHIGTTVMPFLKLYNNCLAYEPHPENNKFFHKNIKDNNMSNKVIISNLCVGDKTSKGEMIYHQGNNSGCYYFKESHSHSESNLTSSIRLDDDPNVSSRNDIDFIKIDTEGFELNVLKGAEQTILRNKPLIEIEVNGLSEKHYGINSEIIYNYLYSLGAVLFDSVNFNNYFYFPNDTLCIDPKKIFCFWTGNNQITENRKECLKTIENYTLVTEENIDKYILKSHPLHEAYKYLSETHKADYLRTYFMHFYGGGYTDIKKQTGSWSNSFDKLLENKDMCVLGYTEIGPNGVSGVSDNFYKPYWKELIGNGCYIFRPYTSFTKKWYENMLSILDKNLDLLKENPSRHPRDCIEHFEWTSYPLKWSQILGDVFHPICYEYKDKLLHGLPIPLFYNYL